jgi:hypothetical protein
MKESIFSSLLLQSAFGIVAPDSRLGFSPIQGFLNQTPALLAAPVPLALQFFILDEAVHESIRLS